MKAGKPHNGALVDIGEVIQNGVVFDFKNWQREGEEANMHNLPEAVARLFALLEERKVAYVLVGGIAMLQYVEGRNTQDIDLIVDAEALARLSEVELTGQDEHFARGRFAGLRVDFLFTNHKLFRSVRDSYSSIQSFHQKKIRCATVEGILLLKMFALPSLYRQGAFPKVGLYENDIATLIEAYQTDMKPLLEVLKPHVSESDLKSVREIVGEIEQRIERFQRKQNREG